MKMLREVLTLDRPMLGLDLETTGTNAQKDRIVEIGLEIMKPGEPTKEYRTLINPGVPIPPGATKVHKITDDMVQKAPRFEQLAQNLLKGFFLADFAGYNVRFDLEMMLAEFKRCGISWNYENARVIDGFRLWQIVQPRSLADAVEHWLQHENMVKCASGEPLPARSQEAPIALWDGKMSTRIIAAQLESSDKLPRDVQKLHELCSPGWLDAQGKIQWREGAYRFSFGEHRGKPLQEVPRSYFSWIVKKDFSERVKQVCEAALHGTFPVSPAVMEDQDDEGID